MRGVVDKAPFLRLVDQLGEADLASGFESDAEGCLDRLQAPGCGIDEVLVAPPAEAARMTGYGAAETIDRAAMPLPDAVARTHPDGIDALVDVASDAGQFAALAGHVRSGGTALTTRYVADTETLARAGVTGVNFALSMTAPLLDRLAARVAAGSIVPPPITRVSLDNVPALLGRHTEGKTVITM